MKKSITYWAFPGGFNGGKDPEEAMREAKEAGFDGIELSVGETGCLTFELSDGMIRDIATAADRVGIGISAVASIAPFTYSLTSNDSEKRERGRSMIARQLEIARLLGTDATLVVNSGVSLAWEPAGEVVDYDVAYERILKALQSLAPVAEKNQVYLGLENVWNRFLLSPLEVRDLLDEVGSPYVGAYFDVGNVVAWSYPEQWIRILGDRIKRIHLKDFKRDVGTLQGFVNLLEGDVNWQAVMAELRSIGYNSYLTAEYFPPAESYRQALIDISKSVDHILSM